MATENAWRYYKSLRKIVWKTLKGLQTNFFPKITLICPFINNFSIDSVYKLFAMDEKF